MSYGHQHHHQQQGGYPQASQYGQGHQAYPQHGNQHHQHHEMQHRQQYQQPAYGASGDDFFVRHGENLEHDRKKVVDEYVVQGEPIYDEDTCQKHPNLKNFRKSGPRDLFWALLFMVSFIATIVIAAINGANDKLNLSGTSSSSFTVNGDSIAVSLAKGGGIGIGISLVLCVASLFLMRAYPEGFIWVCNILAVLLFIGLAVLMFTMGEVYSGVIFCIVAVIVALMLWCYRNRIKLSALMLHSATHVILNQFGTVGFAMLTLLVSVGWYFAWLMMVVPTINDFQDSNNTNSAAGVMIVFAFMLYWTMEVCKDVAHVTSAGTMATWYFVGEAVFDIGASIPSFVRATTTSFGSACAAGFLVAILETIEFIVRTSANGRNAICQCIMLCILQCLQNLLRYFNRIALSTCAIFGSSYFESAKLTFEMIQDGSIWGTLINDILLSRVFLIANLAQAAITAVIVWFAFENWLALIGAILVSLLAGGTLFNTVDSASTTLMVATAWFPEVFPAQHPQLRQQLMAAIRQLEAERGGCCGGGDDQQHA